jgi:hypothetical protein
VKFSCRQPTADRHFVVNGSEYTHVQSQENGGRAEGRIASIDQCSEIQTDQDGCLGESWEVLHSKSCKISSKIAFKHGEKE